MNGLDLHKTLVRSLTQQRQNSRHRAMSAKSPQGHCERGAPLNYDCMCERDRPMGTWRSISGNSCSEVLRRQQHSHLYTGIVSFNLSAVGSDQQYEGFATFNVVGGDWTVSGWGRGGRPSDL